MTKATKYSRQWESSSYTEHQNPAQIWSESLAGQDYETFSAIGLVGVLPTLDDPVFGLGDHGCWGGDPGRVGRS